MKGPKLLLGLEKCTRLALASAMTIAIALPLNSCSPPSPPGRTTEDGDVALVPIAHLELGAPKRLGGADLENPETLLGIVTSLAATSSAVYALDAQSSFVHVFDAETGHQILRVGGRGDGPGEFLLPTRVAATETHFYVRDQRRIQAFDLEGHLDRSWLLEQQGDGVLRVANDGVVYTGAIVDRKREGADYSTTYGIAGYSTDGEYLGVRRIPDLGFEKSNLFVEGRRSSYWQRVPLTPDMAWTVTPSGSLVFGVGNKPEVTVVSAGGDETSVRGRFEAVRVHSDEAAWHRQRTIDRARRTQPEWQWNGVEIPSAKPAFFEVLVDTMGRTWFLAQGDGREQECDEPATCWVEDFLIHGFDPRGEYFGTILLPEGVNPRVVAPVFFEDWFVVAMDDADDNTYLARYDVLR